MLRDEVAKWLDSKNNVTNVRTVEISIYPSSWQGVAYTEGDEDKYYLLGFRPKQSRPTCYRIEGSQYDWYVGGYLEGEKTEEHPFGSHWIMIPWIIEGDPDSRIDDFDYEYTRAIVTVEGL